MSQQKELSVHFTSPATKKERPWSYGRDARDFFGVPENIPEEAAVFILSVWNDGDEKRQREHINLSEVRGTELLRRLRDFIVPLAEGKKSNPRFNHAITYLPPLDPKTGFSLGLNGGISQEFHVEPQHFEYRLNHLKKFLVEQGLLYEYNREQEQRKTTGYKLK